MTSTIRELWTATRRRIRRFIRRLRSLSPNIVVWHWAEDIIQELSSLDIDADNFGGFMLKLRLSSTFDEVLISIALTKVFLSAW